MTYSVPYSFVPGTKAKAEEMNANFNDILDKLQVTNNKIDNANTTIENNNTSVGNSLILKANTDLSNLSEVGQGKIDAKANNTDIDGRWISSFHTLAAEGKTIAKGAVDSYNLSTYLPDDGQRYEVLFSLVAGTSTSSGNVTHLGMRSDIFNTSMEVLKVVTRTSSACFAGTQVLLVVGTTRIVSVYTTSSCSGTPNYALDMCGYRKVR